MTKAQFDELKALLEKKNATNHTACPSCGRCPECGRGGGYAAPCWPWAPYTTPYYYPSGQPYVWLGGTTDGSFNTTGYVSGSVTPTQ